MYGGAIDRQGHVLWAKFGQGITGKARMGDMPVLQGAYR